MIQLAITLTVLVVIAFMIVLYVIDRLRGEISRLAARVSDVETFNVALKERLAKKKPTSGGDAAKSAVQTEQAADIKAVSDILKDKPTPESEPEPDKAPATDDPFADAGKSAAQTPEPHDKAGAVAAKERLEDKLASRWFVWVGAAAIALAGVFLVKYIAERGILTPMVRMVLAFAMGAALAIGGEWLRRRPFQQAIAALKPDYIPMALTTSGLLTMYAAAYAAYGLYDLISPFSAFIVLALVCLLGFALSVLQGVIVAILALMGALIAPALVSTGSPSAVSLFGYLAVTVIACAAVIRFRPWNWLGLVATLGALVWVCLWAVSSYHKGDIVMIGLFAVVMAASFAVLVPTAIAPVFLGFLQMPRRSKTVRQMSVLVALAGLAAAAMGFDFSFAREKASDTSLVVLVGLTAVMLALAYIRPRLAAGVLVPLFMVLAAFFAWAIAVDIQARGWLTLNNNFPPAKPAEFVRFLKWASGFSLALALAGFVVHARVRKPVYWVGLSVLAPLCLLIIAYLALHKVYPGNNWAFAAIIFALAALGACIKIAKGLKDNTGNLPLGLYAAGVVAAISLAMVFLLKDAWLTVALALQLPAIAWIAGQLKVPFLRKVALVICAGLFIRLAVNPFVFDYAKSHFLGEHWVIYGYGIPAIAAHFAALSFRAQTDDRLVTLLEGLRVIFAILLISAEIRIWIHGTTVYYGVNFAETAAQSVAWLAVGWSRLRAFARSQRFADKWSGIVLVALGTIVTFAGSLIIANPVLTRENVGAWPLFNLLALGFVGPAVLIWAISRLDLAWLKASPMRIAIAGAGVLVLLFAYLTLETRHMFQGPVMRPWPISQAETYTYSVVWLIFAFVILMYGLIKKRAVARYAALLVMVVTVLKVFLSDMGDLQGLWRVASFLGLGLSLVGIGFLYQRFLYQSRPRPTKPVAKDQ